MSGFLAEVLLGRDTILDWFLLKNLHQNRVLIRDWNQKIRSDIFHPVETLHQLHYIGVAFFLDVIFWWVRLFPDIMLTACDSSERIAIFHNLLYDRSWARWILRFFRFYMGRTITVLKILFRILNHEHQIIHKILTAKFLVLRVKNFLSLTKEDLRCLFLLFFSILESIIDSFAS